MMDDKKNTVKGIAITERPAIGNVSHKIKIMDLPEITPLDKELLVKVHAAAINLDDILLMQGTSVGRFGGPKPSLEKPYVPGMDFSGVVIGSGNKTSKFKPGDNVFGVIFPQSRRGAWAGMTCVNEKNLFHKPDEIDFIEASAFSTSALAAYIAMMKADTGKTHRCLVIGASGGVGNIIVQLLKSKGAFIIGVCSKTNSDLVKKIGTDMVIDYTKESFAGVLSKSEEQFVDRVFDCIGGKDIESDSFKILKKDGVFITLVGPEKYIGRRKLSLFQFIGMLLYMFRRSITGTITGPGYQVVSTPVSVLPEALVYFIKHKIKILIDRIVPFEEPAIREGIEHVYSRQTKGKTIIKF